MSDQSDQAIAWSDNIVDGTSTLSESNDDESTAGDVIDSLLHHYCDGSSVVFRCDDLSLRYNIHEHEQDLNCFLNRHYGDTAYQNLNTLYIGWVEDPDLVCAILLYFVQKHSHSINSFYLDASNASAFFMHDIFRYLTNNNNNVVLLDRQFSLTNGSSVANNNRIRTAIENCSFFNSWCLNIDLADIIFVLNALAQNEYIQSLQVQEAGPDDQEEEEILIDSITNVVNYTETLSELELNFAGKTMFSQRAWTGLVNAIINSKLEILSFQSVYFNDEELLHQFCRLFENKLNIRALELDFMMFYINDNLHFKSSFFSNLFRNSIQNNKKWLRELLLDFDFTSMNSLETSQEIKLFFALLKDSYIEKLVINGNRNFAASLYKRLFVETMPFMSKLSYFRCSCPDKISRDLLRIILKSIGKCSRLLGECICSLVEENSSAHLSAVAEYNKEARIKIILKRNDQLTACIDNKTKFGKSAYPKIFYVAKPTGPDANYHLLCNLGISVGPKESIFMPGPSIVQNTKTTKTTTEQQKRKFL